MGPNLVERGCAEEIRRFKEMGVCEHVSREAAEAYPGGRDVGVRCAKVNKGTALQPKARRRLVAQESAATMDDELLAGTPPLDGLRLLIFDIGSSPVGAKTRMIMDVKCAFLYGAAGRRIYISFPEQSPLHAGGGILVCSSARCAARGTPHRYGKNEVTHMKGAGV